MATQNEIARRAGVTQATVSMALRNHPAVSKETLELVHRVAKELDYRPNPLVSSLMTHIRSGRHVRDQGTLAVLVNHARLNASDEWITSNVYGEQLRGAQERAEQLGYRVECFFAERYGKSPSSTRLDRVFYARGIAGVLLAPPQNLPESPVRLTWENYAYAAIAYSWKDLRVHRSATHHRHNMDMAFRNVLAHGYRRIGLSLPADAVEGVDANWLAGYLYWQWKLRVEDRIPLFVSKTNDSDVGEFAVWLEKHRPDAILSLGGNEEKRWLDALNFRVPEDIGLACVNRPQASPYSGVEENHEAVGAAAADLLIQQIQSNERGFVKHPKLVLLEGTWVDGNSLRSREAEPIQEVPK
ncbi:MAG: LacI family DNA-binding transcriptional regulator [Candidatus Methylacidiphilales bacterium]